MRGPDKHTKLESGQTIVDMGEGDYYSGGMRFKLLDSKGETVGLLRSWRSCLALDRGMNQHWEKTND